jgi:integrase/recombinase XerD
VRVQEAVNIRKQDIDRDERSITVTTIKSGRYEEDNERTVYYSRSMERTLKRWLDRGGRSKTQGADGDDDDGHPLVTREAPWMGENRITEIVDEVADRTDLQDDLYTDKAGNDRNWIVGHLFRKSYGVHRTKNGMPIAYLTELMGHSDIETTRDHYLKFREDDIRDAERKYAP